MGTEEVSHLISYFQELKSTIEETKSAMSGINMSQTQNIGSQEGNTASEGTKSGASYGNVDSIVRGLTRLQTATSKIISSLQSGSGIDKALTELGTAVDSINSEKLSQVMSSISNLNIPSDIGSSLNDLADGMTRVGSALSGFSDQAKGSLNQIKDLVQYSSELKDLASIIRSGGTISSGDLRKSKDQENLEKARTYLSGHAQDISDQVNKYFESGNLLSSDASGVMSTEMKATKEGLIEVSALVNTATDEYKRFKLEVSDTGKVVQQSVEENTPSIQREVDAIRSMNETRKQHGLLNDKDPALAGASDAKKVQSFEQGSYGWNQMVQSMARFGIKEDEISGISRHVRRAPNGENLESFYVTKNNGDVVTVGASSESILNYKQNIVSVTDVLKEYKKQQDLIAKNQVKAEGGDLSAKNLIARAEARKTELKNQMSQWANGVGKTQSERDQNRIASASQGLVDMDQYEAESRQEIQQRVSAYYHSMTDSALKSIDQLSSDLTKSLSGDQGATSRVAENKKVVEEARNKLNNAISNASDQNIKTEYSNYLGQIESKYQDVQSAYASSVVRPDVLAQYKDLNEQQEKALSSGNLHVAAQLDQQITEMRQKADEYEREGSSVGKKIKSGMQKIDDAMASAPAGSEKRNNAIDKAIEEESSSIEDATKDFQAASDNFIKARKKYVSNPTSANQQSYNESLQKKNDAEEILKTYTSNNGVAQRIQDINRQVRESESLLSAVGQDSVNKYISKLEQAQNRRIKLEKSIVEGKSVSSADRQKTDTNISNINETLDQLKQIGVVSDEAQQKIDKLRSGFASQMQNPSDLSGVASGIGDVADAYNRLADAAERYYNISRRAGNGQALSIDDSLFYQNYDKTLKSINSKSQNDLTDVERLAKERYEQITRSINLKNIQSNLNGQLDTLVGFQDKGNHTTGFSQEVQSAIDSINKLKTEMSRSGGSVSESILTEWTTQADKLASRVNDISAKESSSILANPNKIARMNEQTTNWLNNNPAAYTMVGPQIEKIQSMLSGGQVTKDDQAFAGTLISRYKQAAEEAGKVGASGFSRFNTAIQQQIAYLFDLNTAISAVRSGIENVIKLDDAITEMRKVSDESLSSLQEYQKQSFDIADQVGTTSYQLENSTADWMRLGESFSQAKESAKTSNVLLNVSEFDNISDATTALVSASQAYQNISKMGIVDKLNNIGNNFSISTDQLASGLQNAGAVLSTQGNDIDEALALLTAGNAINQNISKTSMGVRTISLRIAGTEQAKDELSDMGEDVDDFVVRTRSKTDEIIKAYTAVASNNYKGVSVLDDNGNLRSTYSILLDISKIYKEIQAEDKKAGTNRAQALVEELAGKNRSNIAASILQNPDLLENVKQESENSEGSANEELNKYLESASGKVDKLKNRLQELSYVSINTDGLKIMIDLLTSGVKLVTDLSKSFGSLSMTAGAIGGGIFAKDYFSNIVGQVSQGNVGFGKSFENLGFGRIIKSFKTRELDEVSTELTKNMDLGKAFSDQIDTKKLDLLPDKVRAVAQSFVDGENAGKNAGEAIASMTAASATGFEKLGMTIKGVAAASIQTAAVTAGFTLVAALIGKIIEGIVSIITYSDRVIEKGEKAKSVITDTYKEFENTQKKINELGAKYSDQNGDSEDSAQKTTEDSIKAIGKKYETLRQGVNTKTNENISLTTDQYQQYLDITSEIAEQYPTLVAGYDSQGNAILTLGNSAETATSQLLSLYQASSLSANIKIGENLQSQFDGAVQKIKKLNEQKTALETQKETVDSSIPSGRVAYAQDSNGFIVDQYGESDFEQYLLKQNHAMITSQQLNNGKVEIFINGENLSSKEMRSIANGYAPSDSLTIEKNKNQAKSNELGSKISAYNLQIEDEKKAVATSISDYLKTSKTFQGFNAGLQSAILSGVSDTVNLDTISTDYGGDIEGYVYSEIIAPLDGLKEKERNYIAQALTLNKTKQTPEDYQSQVESIFSSVTKDSKERDRLLSTFGFTQTFEDNQEARNKLVENLKRNATNFTDRDLNKINSLNIGQIEQANSLVSQTKFTSVDNLMKKLREKAKEDKSTGTLKDLFTDDTVKTIDNTKKSIESLSDAQTKLLSGDLGQSDINSLIESFPELAGETDHLSQAIDSLKTDKMKSLVTTLSQQATTLDLSEDQVKAYNEYIQQLVDSFGKLDVSAKDVNTKIWGLFGKNEYGKDNGQQHQATSKYEAVMSAKFDDGSTIRDKMATSEGRQILYELALNTDSATWTAEEWISHFENKEVKLKLTANEEALQQAQARIEKNSALISSGNAETQADLAQGKYGLANATNDHLSSTYDKNVNDSKTAMNLALNVAKSTGTDTDWKAYYSARETYYKSISDAITAQQAADENGAQKWEDQISNLESKAKASDAEISARKSDGKKASKRLYENRAAIAQQEADEWKAEEEYWTAKAKESRDKYGFNSASAKNARSKAAEAKSNRISKENEASSMMTSYTTERVSELTAEATKYENLQSSINDYISYKQANGLKANAEDYKDLIKYSTAQISNLKKQNDEYQDAINSTRGLSALDKSNYENTIGSNQNKISELQTQISQYENTLKHLEVSDAETLSSAISDSLSQMATNTGVSADTVQQLTTSFSDLRNNADISKIFYDTADGVKVDIYELKNLAEQQNALVESEFDRKFAEAQKQGTEAMREVLQERAQYFAQYQAQMEKLNAHAMVDFADSTKNEGANYDKGEQYYQDAKKAYENGLIGTDDFKARAAYFDAYGFKDVASFEKNLPKIERYMTEDSTGVSNFLSDLQSKGLATTTALSDGTEGLAMNFKSMAEAAQKMGMSEQWFTDMFGKLKDYGAEGSIVTSMEDATLQTKDLQTQLTDAKEEYADLIAQGASSDVLKKKQEEIDGIKQNLSDLNETTKSYVEGSSEEYLKGFSNVKDELSYLKQAYDEAGKEGDVDSQERFKEKMEQLADKYHLDLKADLSLDESSYDRVYKKLHPGGYESSGAERTLSAQEVGLAPVTDEKTAKQVNNFQYVTDKIKKAHKENNEVYADATKVLSDYTAEELKAINLSNGQYDTYNGKDLSQAEKALDSLKTEFGLTDDQAQALAYSLQAVGETKVSPEDLDNLDKKMESAKKSAEGFMSGFKQSKYGKGAEGFSLDSDISHMTTEELSTWSGNLEHYRLYVDAQPGDHSEVDAYLDSLKQKADIQLKIHEAVDNGMTLEQIKNMSDEELSATFHLNGTEQVEQFKQELDELDKTSGYDFSVHIDDSQFQQLLEQITHPHEMNVEAKVNHSQVDSTDKGLKKKRIVTVEYQNQGGGTAQTNEQAHNGTGGGGISGSVVDSGGRSTITNSSKVAPNTITQKVVYDTDTTKVTKSSSEIKKKPIIQTVIQKVKSIASVITGGKSSSKSTTSSKSTSTSGSQKIKVTADTSSAKKAISTLTSQIKKLKGKTVKVKASVSGTSSVNSLGSAINRLRSRNVSEVASVSGVGTTRNLANEIDRLRSRTITITTQHVTTNITHNITTSSKSGKAAGTAHVARVSGTAYANGTVNGKEYSKLRGEEIVASSLIHPEKESKHAYAGGSTEDWALHQDEDALVNEVGTESIVRNGKWMKIPGGAHFEPLHRGDIVFSAAQTEELEKYGKVYSNGGHGKVAYAGGTVGQDEDVDAFAAGVFRVPKKLSKGSSSSNSSSRSSGGSSRSSGKSSGGSKKSSGSKGVDVATAVDNFSKWLASLFDWIEVRLDRVKDQIDLNAKKMEVAVGYVGKNQYVNNEMKLTGTGKESYRIVTEKDRYGVDRVTGIKDIRNASPATLIGSNMYGAQRYLAEAQIVYNKATSGNTKMLDAATASKIVREIQAGTIDISKYATVKKSGSDSEENPYTTFISAYKEWYDKAMDCVSAVEELRKQLKDLENTKLTNITNQFDALSDLWTQSQESRKSMVEYFTQMGDWVNSGNIFKYMNSELGHQWNLVNTFTDEYKAYQNEMKSALRIFGKDSNEYHEAQKNLEKINQQLIDAKTNVSKFEQQIYELPINRLENVVDRISQFGTKLASLVTLFQSRGKQTPEDLYNGQMNVNNRQIDALYKDRELRIREIAEFGWKNDSEQYKAAYDAISKDDQEILKLLNDNETLKQSVRDLRWDSFTKLEEALSNSLSDLESLRSFITDDEMLDTEDGTTITGRGFAALALLSQEMATAKKQIADYRVALEKLQQELNNGNITQEKYTEESQNYISAIQKSASSVETYKNAIVDLYKTQITNENKALTDLIDKRKDALSAKKSYYEYDKTIKDKNKDIMSIQAQINALRGVTNDAGKAKLAKLQADLAEKQQDLQDEIRQHQYETQSSGYDTLSDDASDALEKATKNIEGSVEKQNEIISNMLNKTKDQYQVAYDEINNIIKNTGTVIGDVADQSVKKISDSVGKVISDMASEVKLPFSEDANSKANNINTGKIDTGYNTRMAESSNTVSSIEKSVSQGNTEDQINEARRAKAYNDASSALKKRDYNTAISGFSSLGDYKDSKTQLENAKKQKAAADAAAKAAAEKKAAAERAAAAAKKAAQAKAAAAKATTTKKTSQTSKRKSNNSNVKLNDQLKSAIQKGQKRSKTLSKQEKNPKIHNELWQYLVSKYGYAPNDKVYWNLANLLGLKSKNMTEDFKRQILSALKKKGLRNGSTRVGNDGMVWMDEELGDIGPEMIIRKSDHAILTRVQANDSVIPADLADNLFKWGAMNPDSFIRPGTSIPTNVQTVNHSVQVSYGSLLTVNGNVDRDALPELKEILQKSYEYTTKELKREARKSGMK